MIIYTYYKEWHKQIYYSYQLIITLPCLVLHAQTMIYMG